MPDIRRIQLIDVEFDIDVNIDMSGPSGSGLSSGSAISSVSGSAPRISGYSIDLRGDFYIGQYAVAVEGILSSDSSGFAGEIDGFGFDSIEGMLKTITKGEFGGG